jgi:hypothetical protein
MHTPYITNEEDIKFPKVLSTKQCLGAKEITSTISPGLKLRQGVVHCVPQPLVYNLADMQQLTPHIHEVIAFTTWLSAKQILPKSAV